MSWFVFAIPLPIPIADASDPAARTKRNPKATTMRGDWARGHMDNKDEDEEEGAKDTEKRGKDDEEGDEQPQTLYLCINLGYCPSHFINAYGQNPTTQKNHIAVGAGAHLDY